MDDVMASHVNKKVNDDFLDWANKEYGEIGKVKRESSRLPGDEV